MSSDPHHHWLTRQLIHLATEEANASEVVFILEGHLDDMVQGIQDGSELAIHEAASRASQVICNSQERAAQ